MRTIVRDCIGCRPVEVAGNVYRRRDGKLKPASPRRVAILIVAVDAVPHIKPGQAKTKAGAFADSARTLYALAIERQTAAFEAGVKVRIAGSRFWNQIDNAADCIRPVDGRARAAQDFDAIEIVWREVGNKRKRRSVDVRRVAHPQAVKQNCRIKISLTANSQRGDGAGRSLLLHAQARRSPQRLGQ